MNAPAAANAFEEIARQRKVDRIVAYVDGGTEDDGFHPEDTLVAAELANKLKGYGPEQWKRLAKEAGCKNKPSPITQRAVIAVYEQRGLV